MVNRFSIIKALNIPPAKGKNIVKAANCRADENKNTPENGGQVSV